MSSRDVFACGAIRRRKDGSELFRFDVEPQQLRRVVKFGVADLLQPEDGLIGFLIDDADLGEKFL